jgi:hypothetical protein
LILVPSLSLRWAVKSVAVFDTRAYQHAVAHPPAMDNQPSRSGSTTCDLPETGGHAVAPLALQVMVAPLQSGDETKGHRSFLISHDHVLPATSAGSGVV